MFHYHYVHLSALAQRSVSVSVRDVSVRLFADGESIAVLVAVVRMPADGLWRILFRLVVDLGRGAEALLPVPRPIVILHGHLLGRLGVPAHRNAIDQAAHQRQEAEYQENDAEHPARTERTAPDE